MERTEILDMMGTLKLFGMKSAYNETLATAIKRKHEPQRFVGDPLRAEISEKQARSIRYQMTIAELTRDVMPLRQAVQCLAAQEFLSDLSLELNAVGSVLCHGLLSFESPASRSIHSRPPVRLKGPTPASRHF